MASLYGSYIFASYFLAIIPSYPKDETVRIFTIAYMIKFDESLYEASVLSLKPVLNAIWMTPAMIIKGKSPRATRAVLH